MELNEYIRRNYKTPNPFILKDLGACDELITYLRYTPENTNFNVADSYCVIELPSSFTACFHSNSYDVEITCGNKNYTTTVSIETDSETGSQMVMVGEIFPLTDEAIAILLSIEDLAVEVVKDAKDNNACIEVAMEIEAETINICFTRTEGDEAYNSIVNGEIESIEFTIPVAVGTDAETGEHVFIIDEISPLDTPHASSIMSGIYNINVDTAINLIETNGCTDITIYYE